MSSRPSDVTLQQLASLLGSLARMVLNGSQLNESELQILLVGIDCEHDPAALMELKLWGRLLKTLCMQPTPDLRRATVEALMLRGLLEVPVLLAVDTVTSSRSKPKVATNLSAAPTNLDFGTLIPGQGGSIDFRVQGGPGQIVVESDQLRVTPLQFGYGITPVRVEVRPLTGGLLWTTLKLVTTGETLEVPVLAQWAGSATPTQYYPSIAPSPQPTPAQNADILAMINDELDKSFFDNQPVSQVIAQPKPTQGSDADILEQLRRLMS